MPKFVINKRVINTNASLRFTFHTEIDDTKEYYIVTARRYRKHANWKHIQLRYFNLPDTDVQTKEKTELDFDQVSSYIVQQGKQARQDTFHLLKELSEYAYRFKT